MKSSSLSSKFSSITNVIVVCAIASVACVQLWTGFAGLVHQPSFGDFGFSLDESWRVAQVTPGGSADAAGLRVGDIVDRALPLRDRLIFQGPAFPDPGERATFAVERAGKHHHLTIVARHYRYALADAISGFWLQVTCAVFLIVGMLLALIRPSKMTWAFYLASLAVMWAGPGPPPRGPTDWYLTYIFVWQVIIVPAGAVGFLVFWLRFPSNSVSGWRRTIDNLAPTLLILLTAGQAGQFIARFLDIMPPAFDYWWQHIWDLGLVVLGAVGMTSLAGTYRSSSGLERQRIKWVVFGTACAVIAIMLYAWSLEPGSDWPAWLQNAAVSLILVLPLTVAYAVIRYRVVDVRFVISRALVLGVIAAFLIGVIFALDRIFSSRFANSPSLTAAYAGVALLVGFMLNAARQRIATTVDALFFRQWHRTKRQADAIGDSIGRAVSRTDILEPLTGGIASAFSLASTALFERVDDGGFVRVAAQGWPPKTLWHLLPSDPVAKRAQSLLPIDIDALGWIGQALPAGVARPSLGMPIGVGNQMLAVLLCGAHDNGTGLDPNEIRAIRNLCVEAGRVYSRTQHASDRADFMGSRSQDSSIQVSASL
jgi:hypothetical protein